MWFKNKYLMGNVKGKYIIPTSCFLPFSVQTGIGATTWEDTNIQVTRAALRTAPR
jgi:hypothetical protein